MFKTNLTLSNVTLYVQLVFILFLFQYTKFSIVNRYT